MQEYAKLVLAVDSAQARTAKKDLDSLTESGSRTERSAKGMTGAFSALKGALAAIGAGAIVRGIVQQADTYQLLQGRLALTTKNAEDLAHVQRQLFELSQRTATAVQDQTELYIGLSGAASELGATQAQLLQFTEGVGNALRLSSTSAQGASSAILQLTQLIGGSVVQAQEFNALLDNGRTILVAVANNLDKAGGSVGRLRALVKDGQVSSAEFFDAFLRGADDINAKAASMERTVGQALTQLKNELFRGLGQTNTSPLVGAIDDLRAKIADPEFQRSLIDTATGIAELTAVMVKLASLGAEPFREFHSFGTNLGYIAAKVTGNVTQLDLLEHEIQDVDRALKNSFLGKPTKYLFTPEEELRQIRAGLEFGRNILLNGGKPAPRLSTPDGTTSGSGGKTGGGPSASGSTSRVSEAQRLIQSMREELLIGAELSRLEQVRIGLKAGLYGKYSTEEEKSLERLAHELDTKKKLADADQERIDLETQHLSLIEQTRTPLERYQRQVSELNRLRAELEERGSGVRVDDRTYDRRIRQFQEELDAATRVEEKIGKVHGLFSETVLDMEAMARRGAENIQDSLADFLFDPFDRGLKGMVQGFADTLRRMAAEATAQQLMGSIMNLGMSALGGMNFGLPGMNIPIAAGPGIPIPGKASGGLFGPGWTMVGERGPELVHFNGSGRVYNNGETAAMQGGMGGRPVQVTNHITIHAPDIATGRQTAMQAGVEMGRGVQAAMRRNG
jgi:tape measure domain-containing protein